MNRLQATKIILICPLQILYFQILTCLQKMVLKTAPCIALTPIQALIWMIQNSILLPS